MGMIRSKDNRGELMINLKTGERYIRPFDEAERYEQLLEIQSMHKDAESQLDALTGEGFELEEILDLILTFEK